MVAKIRKMATKLSECDPIPTNILKKIWSSVSKTITSRVNLFQYRIVCTFLEIKDRHSTFKKARFGVTKNYQPVSNLTFLSNLVEKCIMKQVQKPTCLPEILQL